MPSLKDLAKECGVSVATVSKALNDQPDISPATRERVRAAAHRMGYLPNAAARSLKTNRTYNLGVLFVDERQSGLTHEYFSAVLDSFKVEAEKHGYDITFINHNISGKSMSYLEHCRYRNVDGVVIACVNFYEPQVVELVNSEVPVVTIDHVFNNRMAILSDNVFGLKALVRQAWACGHRRIAFIHGEKTAVTENRVAGFYQACEELGLKIPEAYVREGIYHDADRCAAETKALLELPQPPTCIIFPDDFSALGGYNAISEKGLSIPEDVSVMGYDGIYLSRVVKPQLVTYQQNTTALGRTAADKLIELIAGKSQSDRLFAQRVGSKIAEAVGRGQQHLSSRTGRRWYPPSDKISARGRLSADRHHRQARWPGFPCGSRQLHVQIRQLAGHGLDQQRTAHLPG